MIIRGRRVDPSGSIMLAVGATLYFISKKEVDPQNYNTFYRAFVLQFLGSIETILKINSRQLGYESTQTPRKRAMAIDFSAKCLLI